MSEQKKPKRFLVKVYTDNHEGWEEASYTTIGSARSRAKREAMLRPEVRVVSIQDRVLDQFEEYTR